MKSAFLRITILSTMLLLGLMGMAACASTAPPPSQAGEAVIALSSSAFADGATIPDKFTCKGENVSPPLKWDGVPKGTESLTLIMDDPDAPIKDFTHWVIFNLPADARELTEAVPKDESLPSGALQGQNGLMQLGYFGPCPPPGKPHHYGFALYALDKKLDLAAGASKQQVLEAMQGHILGRGQLTGIYQR